MGRRDLFGVSSIYSIDTNRVGIPYADPNTRSDDRAVPRRNETLFLRRLRRHIRHFHRVFPRSRRSRRFHAPAKVQMPGHLLGIRESENLSLRTVFGDHARRITARRWRDDELCVQFVGELHRGMGDSLRRLVPLHAR